MTIIQFKNNPHQSKPRPVGYLNLLIINRIKNLKGGTGKFVSRSTPLDSLDYYDEEGEFKGNVQGDIVLAEAFLRGCETFLWADVRIRNTPITDKVANYDQLMMEEGTYSVFVKEEGINYKVQKAEAEGGKDSLRCWIKPEYIVQVRRIKK